MTASSPLWLQAFSLTAARANGDVERFPIESHKPIPRRPEPKQHRPLELDRTTLTDLYVTRRLDDTAIGAIHGVPAYRVTMRRRELDVHWPPVVPPHPEPLVTPPAADLHRWYAIEGRTLEQIARQHHTDLDTVRAWLQTAGASVQLRTSREDRTYPDPVLLRDLYLSREWTAAEIAADLDTSVHQVLRSLHEHGIPVRRGGPPRRREGDPALQKTRGPLRGSERRGTLRRHRIPERPVPGAITQRFPTPVAITRSFLYEAYAEIGLAAGHIEQLTGQPAERILQRLHDHEIPVRQSGANSPLLRPQRDTR